MRMILKTVAALILYLLCIPIVIILSPIISGLFTCILVEYFVNEVAEG